MVSLLSNFSSHIQSNASSIYLELTLLWVRLQHPVVDLKMELLLKIINDLKL